jgi:predicted dithiol-disulfide oxidoreductase (DUF899 family)
MNNHPIATREQWLAARLDLLEAEKEFTRQRDALTRRRMAMPSERGEVIPARVFVGGLGAFYVVAGLAPSASTSSASATTYRT